MTAKKRKPQPKPKATRQKLTKNVKSKNVQKKKQGIKPGEKKLTPKESLFCIYYCERFNGAQSAIRAGYSEKTARFIAAENLTKPHIIAEISRLRENFEELAQKMGVTKAGVLAEHIKIAYNSIAAFHNTWIERKTFEEIPEEAKAAICEIDTRIEPKAVITDKGVTKTVKIEYVRVKLYDKQKALDSITKIMGWNAEEKIAHSFIEPITGMKIMPK
jgi:phage terminase small subunit